MMKKVVSALFCIFAFVFSQEIALEQFTTKDGLSQNSVTSIVQDSIGFLWFGTYNGLNRYDGYKFKFYQHNPNNPNSLNHNLVRAICVDYKGNLWIGTMGGGLNFYDYRKDSFKSYQYDSEDTTSLSHNSIRSLLIDKDDCLWLGTTSGGVNRFSLLDFYNPDNKDHQIKFSRYLDKNTGISGINRNPIADMYQDRNNNIWIGTRNGLYKFDSKIQSVKYFFSNPDDPNSLLNNNISAINEDKNGNIWVSNWEHGLNQYIPEKQKFIRYPFKENNPYSPSYNMIMCLYKDRQNDLWIGTWGGGLNKLKISGDGINLNTKDQKESFIHFKENSRDLLSIDNISIYSIFEDKSGVIWIGSDWNGLYKNLEKNSKFKNYHIVINKISSRNQNNVFDLRIEESSNNLWLATRYNGINILNLKNNQSKFYMHDSNNPYSINHNKIRTFFKDRNERLWIGSEIGVDEFNYKDKTFIHYILDKENPYGLNTLAIHDDRFGNLWIGTYEAGLFKFNKITGDIVHYLCDSNNPNSISDNTFWKIFEDSWGNLWIGTSKGLNLYDYETDQFIRHLHDPENPYSISGNKILTIFEKSSGQLWFGTTTGLNRLDTKENFHSQLQFTRYTTKDGLPTNTIHGILEDDHGDLWISTNKGLSNFNLIKNTFHNYDESDGLQDIEFSVNACYKDTTTGELYFGGINGFNIFHPDSIKFNKIVPGIVFTELKILNKPVSVNSIINNRIILKESLVTTDSLFLTYDDLMFSIEFSTLHFSSPENNQYAYMLEGFEKNWNYVGADQRTATYTNLDPGMYTFRVKASNNDKIWNEKERVLRIIITPPFWLTWWFRILLVGIIILFILLFFQIRTVQIRKRNKKLAEINTKLNKEIKERNRAENKIKLLNKELEERVKHRTEELESFAYSISHDLRTPLRGIQGFSLSLLEDYEDKLEEKGKNYLCRIVKATKHMSELINDLLILSRVTRKEPIKEEIDLAFIFEDIIKNINDTNPERDLKFIYKKGLIAICDKNLMKLAIENLVSNAVKFTKNKKIAEIEFGKLKRKKKQIFYIRDNGIGFDMKYANKLFEAFQRLQTDYDGTGIGLTTVQRIIQRHGGKVWAEGKVNKGATFFFTLS